MDAQAQISAGESTKWLRSLQNAIPAIVVIRVNIVRAFDGSGASFSHATGFVVDKKRGILLTNRHVVTPGPVVADAIFMNKEEVDLRPIYRDPVHDFGFFQFDPKRVQFMELHEIQLRPEGAKIGVEIRVVGNDAGEKLSILPGILAKLDRDAPHYGSHDYNDFNTFYYAAASSTSGGSSGSPVLNIDGDAIALNAGGAKKAASSFYLPLDRAVRALRLIQEGKEVPRGTLQTIWRHTAFDEVRRLGLSSEMESIIRRKFPSETGMLVVDQVVPGGPADTFLHPGDVLVQFASDHETTFIPIEKYLDENVNNSVTVQIQRGGKPLTFSFKVQDLHGITPNKFLQISGSVIHSLSYQQARNASLPVGGVFMAQAGHMLMRAGIVHQCIITAVDNKATPSLESFKAVFEALPNGYRTSMKYFVIRDRHRMRTSVITVDRQWFPMLEYTRNDQDGLWHAIRCKDPPPCVANTLPKTLPVPLTFNGEENIKKLMASIVMVTFDIPYMIDGISSSSYAGVGVVLDHVNGFILVDRNTIPIALGDVLITVAASIELQGKVVFVHPIHNYSIVSYDPSLLGDMSSTVLTSIELAEETVTVGSVLNYIGLTHNYTIVTQRPQVTKLDRLTLRECHPPRYRATNVEVIHFDRVTKSVGGIFANDEGKVVALWLSFSYQDDVGRKEVFRGLPVVIMKDVVNTLQKNKLPEVRVLPVQLMVFPLSKARAGMGLADHWIQKLENRHTDKRQVLAVKRSTANTDASSKLLNGDLLLCIDGKVVSKDLDVELACSKKEKVELKVFRDNAEVTVQVETTKLSTIGTSRVIIWSGIVIHEPHYEVLSLGYLPEESGGVYCSRWCYGSPAHKYGLRATIWIIEVNGISTPDLNSFLEVVEKLGNGEFVRIKTKDLNTKTKVFTLKTDYHYYPTVEISRNSKTNQWELMSMAKKELPLCENQTSS